MGEGARARPCPHSGELSLKVEHASTLFPRENAKGDNIADEIANSLAAAVETETTHSAVQRPSLLLLLLLLRPSFLPSFLPSRKGCLDVNARAAPAAAAVRPSGRVVGGGGQFRVRLGIPSTDLLIAAITQWKVSKPPSI